MLLVNWKENEMKSALGHMIFPLTLFVVSLLVRCNSKMGPCYRLCLMSVHNTRPKMIRRLFERFFIGEINRKRAHPNAYAM
jgi:hypothetical protein